MCPSSDIKFYLYTRKNQQDRQLIYADGMNSNLSNSNFNPGDPTKIILHGYNSDMFLTPLIQMKGGKLLLYNNELMSCVILCGVLLNFYSRTEVS